jgi:hypothetical protein
MRRAIATAMMVVLVAGHVGGPSAPTSRAALIPTTLTLATGPQPFPADVPITITATVSPAHSTSSGVFFERHGLVLGQAPIDGAGVATFTYPYGFSPGIHQITARYWGDGHSYGSSTATVDVTVVEMREPVEVSLSVEPTEPTLRGDPVVIRVAVSPDPGAGNLTVTHAGHNVPLGPGGTYEATVPLTGLGTYDFKACFHGTAVHAPGCSSVISHATYQKTSTTTLTFEPSIIYPGDQVRVAVSVWPVPEEHSHVSVHGSGQNFAVGLDPVTGLGEVTITPDGSEWPLRDYDMRADFAGTMQLAPSVSATKRLTVRLDPTTLDVSTSAGVAAGEPLTFHATVTPAQTIPEAGVTFFVSGPPAHGFGEHVDVVLDGSGTGKTIVNTTRWPAGDYWYDAKFGGDPKRAPAVVRGYFTLGDIHPPAGTLVIGSGAVAVTSSNVTLHVLAHDELGTGVHKVALSNDGVTWIQQPYAATVPWTLAPGDGTRIVRAKWVDHAGNWSSISTASVIVDTITPTATGPRQSLVTATSVSNGKVTVRADWTAKDPGSGIVRYELAQSTDGGAWKTVGTTLTKAASTRLLAPGHTYRFRVRAVDAAGNVSAWATGSTITLSRYQESSSRISYSGTWKTSWSSGFWGGAAKKSSTAGSKASITFTGRSIGWISRVGPTRGKATVYVNGTKVASVDLYSPMYESPKVVWTRTWTDRASRTITVRVSGTSGRPRVDLDAFVTLN